MFVRPEHHFTDPAAALDLNFRVMLVVWVSGVVASAKHMPMQSAFSNDQIGGQVAGMGGICALF